VIGSAGQYLEIRSEKGAYRTHHARARGSARSGGQILRRLSRLREFQVGSRISFEFAVVTEKDSGIGRKRRTSRRPVELYRDNKSILTRPVAVVP